MKRTIVVGRQLPIVLALMLVGACSKQEPAPQQNTEVAPPTPAAPSPPPAADPAYEARNLFKSRCVVCHGSEGKGDGVGAAALTPKPRNYTDSEWQKSVTDDEISKTILKGGAAVGKSPGMPPNPDLESKPEVLAELVKYVRSFAK